MWGGGIWDGFLSGPLPMVEGAAVFPVCSVLGGAEPSPVCLRGVDPPLSMEMWSSPQMLLALQAPHPTCWRVWILSPPFPLF